MFITDFEKSLMNAISKIFNALGLSEELRRPIKLQGWLFHYSQCLIRTFSKYYNIEKIEKVMKEILYFTLCSVYKMGSIKPVDY